MHKPHIRGRKQLLVSVAVVMAGVLVLVGGLVYDRRLSGAGCKPSAEAVYLNHCRVKAEYLHLY